MAPPFPPAPLPVGAECRRHLSTVAWITRLTCLLPFPLPSDPLTPMTDAIPRIRRHFLPSCLSCLILIVHTW